MSFRTVPQSTEEHIAYIYELLRRLRVPVVFGEVVEDEPEPDCACCPCIAHVRVCAPGAGS